MNQKLLRDRYRGCFLGLAIGDALGAPCEFADRDSYPLITEYRGGGPFLLEPGEWTDDTSMAICLAESLLACNGFDPEDQLERYYGWWKFGINSVNGRCFDIGATTLQSLIHYEETVRHFRRNRLPLDNADFLSPYGKPNHSGNGSVMRLAPVPMFFQDLEEARKYSVESSLTTHASAECQKYCGLLGELLFLCLNTGEERPELRRLIDDLLVRENVPWDLADLERYEIRSSGYVVHTVQAALWCVYRTNSFVSAVCTAVNLGEDTDTVGAVTGQIAGAYYGLTGIPKFLYFELAYRRKLLGIADRLYEHRRGSPCALNGA